jgi:hypothetical protein
MIRNAITFVALLLYSAAIYFILSKLLDFIK